MNGTPSTNNYSQRSSVRLRANFRRRKVALDEDLKANSTSAAAKQSKPPLEFRGKFKNSALQEARVGYPFLTHNCGAQCLADPKYHFAGGDDEGKWSPLQIPIALGWRRVIARRRRPKDAFYVAPCGRRLRDVAEVHAYLLLTSSSGLQMDFFDFDWSVKVCREWTPEVERRGGKDASRGAENVPVPWTNSLVDEDTLPQFEYSTLRLPQAGVAINTDADFRVCCDCVDDCRDREKCACQQLTVQGTVAEGLAHSRAGYAHRRLLEQVVTGIYECNPRCDCSDTCLNRVAQNPMRARLQVFKTEKMGWGMRTLADIPRGAFVCLYVGKLYSGEESDSVGQESGDTYFAELDLIEVAEGCKEGYESDVEQSHSKDHAAGDNAFASESTDLVVRKSTTPKFKSTRKYFGNNEESYVIDAAEKGNIGRYMNHSCSPNIFVQNCFVDTHDLRFPWLAFFASDRILAGRELCWDYCYPIDQVKGKRIDCACGATNCRKRLL